MSLIHEALEKAKKSPSKVEFKKVEAREERKRRVFWWPVILGLLFLVVIALVFLLDAGVFKKVRNLKTGIAAFVMSHRAEDSKNQSLENDSLTSNQFVSAGDSAQTNLINFRESFNRALNTGNIELLKELALNNPDSLSFEDFKRVLKIFMTLNDYPVVNEIAHKADEAGKLDADLLLELAKYFEQKNGVVSAYYYRRSYFAGNFDPILLAKTGSLYDNLGLKDSAVKYYRAYLNVADTGDLYFNIKRRVDYLAGGK